MGASRSLGLIAVAAAAAASMGAVQAATADSASFSLQAHAEFGALVSDDPQSASWGTLLSSLSMASNASVDDGAGNIAQAFGSGTATWASADAGSVAFGNYGWNVATSGAATAVNLTTAPPDWTYSFDAVGADSSIAFTYAVTGTGNTFGLWGWDIFVYGGPEGVQQVGLTTNPSDPTATGTFAAHLTAGNVYTATLVNNANLFSSGGLTTAGSMNGQFDWQISAVPEAQSYALMLAGLIALGFVARRRSTR